MSEGETRRERGYRHWRESDWSEIAAFLGPNADKFRSAYEKTRDAMVAERPRLVWTWCWPALFLSFAWFFYRKQWAIGAVVLILPIALGYFLDASAGATGGVAIVLAAMAKSAVVQDAVGRIGMIKEAGGGHDEIVRAGGVSIAGGVVGGVILAVALVATVYTLMLDRAAPGEAAGSQSAIFTS